MILCYWILFFLHLNDHDIFLTNFKYVIFFWILCRSKDTSWTIKLCKNKYAILKLPILYPTMFNFLPDFVTSKLPFCRARRLDMLCRPVIFMIIVFFIIILFVRLYLRVCILLTCGKHVHDCIISMKGEVWAYQTK